ncbi:MAG: HNH endonuclease [Gammaproteobacteria bacterium]
MKIRQHPVNLEARAKPKTAGGATRPHGAIPLRHGPSTQADRSTFHPLAESHNASVRENSLSVAGEPHPYNPMRATRLHIGHIVDKSHGGSDEANNLRAVCSICNEGAANLTLDRPTATKLQVRRATITDQLELLKWLARKYPNQVKDLSKDG